MHVLKHSAVSSGCQLAAWLIGWPPGCLISWLARLLGGQLAAWLMPVGCLADWAKRLAGCLHASASELTFVLDSVSLVLLMWSASASVCLAILTWSDIGTGSAA